MKKQMDQKTMAMADENSGHEQPPPFNDLEMARPCDDSDEQQPLLHDDEFRGRPSPPSYAVYQAKYKVQPDGSGVISRDPHLNDDGEALLQFLYQHNTIPGMKVKFHGYHEETFWRPRHQRDNDEESQSDTMEPVTQRVEDFCFEIDCSQAVDPRCLGVQVLPDPSTGQTRTVRALCDDYVHERNRLKELRMTKVLGWEYAELTQALTTAIRDHGYHHCLEITYEMTNHKVTVKTGSSLSRMADDRFMRFLCFITCIWIIVWPAIHFSKKTFGRTTLQSQWRMTVPAQSWYQYHIQQILAQILPVHPRQGTVPFIL